MYGGALHILSDIFLLTVVAPTVRGPVANCSCMDRVSKSSERGKRRPKWQCDVIAMHEGDEQVASDRHRDKTP